MGAAGLALCAVTVTQLSRYIGTVCVCDGRYNGVSCISIAEIDAPTRSKKSWDRRHSL